MTNLTKFEFAALDVSGNNYLSWILDAEIHLEAMNLGRTIQADNDASQQDRAKALIFLRHHIHEGLKNEYLTEKDPRILWYSLKERYNHQRTVILPKARYDWSHLRLQDFKSVAEYNSALFSITSQLKLCGQPVTDEDMLEKTYSTFHQENIVLQEQFRQCNYKKYSTLISVLLVAEQHNKLLITNHESRPTGSTHMPEAHASNFRGYGRGRGRGHRGGRGRGYGQGRGRGRNNSRYNYYNPGGYNQNNSDTRNTRNTQRNDVLPKQDKDKGVQKQYEDICYKCGMKCYWSRTYRTSKYLVDLYQASIKNQGKGKNVEINFNDVTALDASEFIKNSDDGTDYLIGDESIFTD